jgi:uncharacterized membrane protein YtjA (UPF0391 family)
VHSGGTVHIQLCFRSRMTIKKMRTEIMLNWAITFLIVALVAALLGFSGIAGTAAWMAHTLFVVFLVLFLVSLIAGPRVRI